jgi:hypothetical protein
VRDLVGASTGHKLRRLKHIETQIHDRVGSSLRRRIANPMHRKPLFVDMTHADHESNFGSDQLRSLAAEQPYRRWICCR